MKHVKTTPEKAFGEIEEATLEFMKQGHPKTEIVISMPNILMVNLLEQYNQFHAPRPWMLNNRVPRFPALFGVPVVPGYKGVIEVFPERAYEMEIDPIVIEIDFNTKN